MVRGLVAVALANMAVLKNVDINDALRDQLPGSVLDHMHPYHIQGIAERDPSGVAALSREINAQLDAVVLVRMRDMIAGMEDKADLNDPLVVALSNEIAARYEASLANRQNFRWENPYSLVLQHYADKPGRILRQRPTAPPA